MLPQDLDRWYVRNGTGQMVPFSAFSQRALDLRLAEAGALQRLVVAGVPRCARPRARAAAMR